MITSIFTTLGSASNSNSVDSVEYPEHGEDGADILGFRWYMTEFVSPAFI